MSKCAMFVDISNLYYCVGKRFEGRKLDYQKLMDVSGSYGPLQRASAYGAQVKDEATSFITCLRKIGYDTKYKEPRPETEGEKRSIRKADWEVGIAVDVVRVIDRVDTVILCSANAAFSPLASWIKDQGVRLVVVACGISRELKDLADQWVEIDEELLEEVKNAA